MVEVVPNLSPTGATGFDAFTPALIADSSLPPAALLACAAPNSADVGVLLWKVVPPAVVPVGIVGFAAATL